MKFGMGIVAAIFAAIAVMLVLWFTPLGTAPLTAMFPVPPVETIDFGQIKIERVGHTSLMCPTAEMCPERDDGTAIYDADLAKMRNVWAAAVKAEPRMELVHSDDALNQYTYVVRSVMWRMPDLVTVQFIDQSDRRQMLGRDADRYTLAVFSRSLYGVIDLDANGGRVRRMLAFLDSHLDTYKR